MPVTTEPSHVARVMTAWIGLELISCTELQTLWAGYGHICAIQARHSAPDTASPQLVNSILPPLARQGETLSLILKIISPPTQYDGDDEGHLRKMLSYEVEQYLYEEIAPRLDGDIAFARPVASTRSMRDKAKADGLENVTAILMTDLREDFPVAGDKRSILTSRQVHSALEWLAKFHRSSWHVLPRPLDKFILPPLEEAERRERGLQLSGDGLWLNGGYTYLATRRKEYRQLAEDNASEWTNVFCTTTKGSQRASIAEDVAKFLTPVGRPFETYIHGDVKSENLFSTILGDQVAFFDFQYAGLGLGVCDLAELFTCSVPLDMLISSRVIPTKLEMGQGERALLEVYRSVLLSKTLQGQARDYEWGTFVRHWETALVDWCRFQASWGFWGNTRWLQARVRYILDDKTWREWLHVQM